MRTVRTVQQVTRRLPILAALLVASAVGAGALLGPHDAAAQTPTSTPTPPARPTPTDAQALAVEQQLLCPLCVNERLDICILAICNDMKQMIRERLAAGSTPDDIILFFETRFGPKVRAELPKEGFNLVLFGWVGGGFVLIGGLGGYALYSMRRDTRRRRARAASTTALSAPVDDRWVDQLREEATGEASDGDAASRGGR